MYQTLTLNLHQAFHHNIKVQEILIFWKQGQCNAAMADLWLTGGAEGKSLNLRTA